MKKVAIDWLDLEEAFDSPLSEANYYLDLETGRVMVITEETRYLLEEIYTSSYDPDDPDAFDLDAAIKARGLADWQEEDLRAADHLEMHFGSGVIGIPSTGTREAYRDMEKFIQTVQDPQLQDRLWRAIQGRGAFRLFRYELDESIGERERWYAFKDNRATERIRSWLESEGIEPLNVPEPRGVDMDKLLELRGRLLDEVLLFVRAAKGIPGVTRIALIGSLTTDKPDPKDADILVTVLDDADLTQLATQARKLNGHAQRFNRGGEVFLANPQSQHLGRTCPWKQCGPGIRASCDALHCGRREYLHDDMETARLSEDLIASPPIELWPQTVTRVLPPEDLLERVLRPLAEDDR